MNLDEIQSKIDSGVDHLWWTSRYLGEALRRRGTAAPDEKARAARCFVLLANADPSWALGELTEMGPRGHELSELMSGERLALALDSLTISPLRLDALLRAQLMMGRAQWVRDEELRDELCRRAWAELTRVPDEERDDAWRKAAFAPASRADFSSYRILAQEKLNTT